MKYKRMKTECFKIVPIIPLGDEGTIEDEVVHKKTILAISKMNNGFYDKGRGRSALINGEMFYRDMPNFSYKLFRKGGKAHQYMTVASDEELQQKIKTAVKSDIVSCHFDPGEFDLKKENLHAFSIKGNLGNAIKLDGRIGQLIPDVLKLEQNADILVNLTLKEVENHDKKREEIKKYLSGYNPDDPKSVTWYEAKRIGAGLGKFLYKFWFNEDSRVKHQKIIENLKKRGHFQKKELPPQTKRRLAEQNRYMTAEILFLIWTKDTKQAERFRSQLQKKITAIQGENTLEATPVKPDLSRIKKGHLQYDLPHLCLYQKEMSHFLHMPSVHELDSSFYAEHEQKTEIPAEAIGFEVGGSALGMTTDTKKTIALPRAATETDLDDRGTPTLISGKKGSGKTQLLINQVADTFCLGASSMDEWREKARSAVVFDVADGDMIREIYELVPHELKNRVIILNHADLDNPLPITNRDVLDIAQTDGFASEIADLETQMLMDSLKDKSSTVSVERHFKTALQASYLAGKGNLIDAMRIIEEPGYRNTIIQKLEADPEQVYMPLELRKMDILFEKPEALETIDNRISRLKNIQPWIDALAQEPTEGMDFWKWINGDKDGAYLVLICIPNHTNKRFRSFLFAHYLTKIWYMTKAREMLNKVDRKEFLVIVDELHQIFGHRVVTPIMEEIYKESRKYRGRYVFTLHGWSSIKDTELKNSMKDASGNYIMLKGGDDMFSELGREFKPYTVADFNSLMALNYTGLFKVDIKKKTHVFQARLMPPASTRYKKYRSIDLATFRKRKNLYGRPKREVRAALKNKGDEKTCNSQPKEQKSLEAELAEITGGNDSQKVN